ISGQGNSQATILWDSLSTGHSFTVTETTASGCTATSPAATVHFDASVPELLSVGINEAETELVLQYRVKQAQHYPQNQITVQVQNNQSGQWQPQYQADITNTVFSAPANNFEAAPYRLQGFNRCGTELLSKVHQPVRLTATAREATSEVVLRWSRYRGWSGQITYEVWRQLEGQNHYEKLTATTDTSLALKTGRDGFQQRYRIKAVSITGLESWSKSQGVSFENALLFPNIITPNGDGLNDFFTAKNLHLYPNSRLKIFNRWGREVFSSQNYSGDWNASGLSSGTYYYLLQTPAGQSFKGWVEVVR
ncbi:MAG TPA: gliding motility-associated C-terminal domain-containing protein, partial [Adhaeribacter sp.]|nr:gliding motility-associated C-terminal domain-containing protein [Adhaeribacter sp.]